jgi:hypothetical protein
MAGAELKKVTRSVTVHGKVRFAWSLGISRRSYTSQTIPASNVEIGLAHVCCSTCAIPIISRKASRNLHRDGPMVANWRDAGVGAVIA